MYRPSITLPQLPNLPKPQFMMFINDVPAPNSTNLSTIAVSGDVIQIRAGYYFNSIPPAGLCPATISTPTNTPGWCALLVPGLQINLQIQQDGKNIPGNSIVVNAGDKGDGGLGNKCKVGFEICAEFYCPSKGTYILTASDNTLTTETCSVTFSVDTKSSTMVLQIPSRIPYGSSFNPKVLVSTDNGDVNGGRVQFIFDNQIQKSSNNITTVQEDADGSKDANGSCVSNLDCKMNPRNIVVNYTKLENGISTTLYDTKRLSDNNLPLKSNISAAYDGTALFCNAGFYYPQSGGHGLNVYSDGTCRYFSNVNQSQTLYQVVSIDKRQTYISINSLPTGTIKPYTSFSITGTLFEEDPTLFPVFGTRPLNGNVIIDVHGPTAIPNKNVPVINGTFTYPIDSFTLTPGSYTFTITYLGSNETYLVSYNSPPFNVDVIQVKLTSSIDTTDQVTGINVKDVTTLTTAKLTGVLLTDTGPNQFSPFPVPAPKLDILFDSIIKTSVQPLDDGSFKFDIDGAHYPLGQHTFSVVYNGDIDHQGAISSPPPITIRKVNTILTVDPIPSEFTKLDTTIDIKGQIILEDKFGPLINTPITVLIDGEVAGTTNSNNTDGKFELNIRTDKIGVSPPPHTIEVDFIETNIYAGIRQATTFTLRKVITALSIDPIKTEYTKLDIIDIKGSIVLEGKFGPLANSPIAITIDGQNVGTTQSSTDGTFSLGVHINNLNISPPSHTIAVSFAETDVYVGINQVTSFNLRKVNTSISTSGPNIPVTKLDNIAIHGIIHLEEPYGAFSGAKLTISIDNQPLSTIQAGNDGDFTITIYTANLSIGTHNVSVVFAEDNERNQSNSNFPFTLRKVNNNLSLQLEHPTITTMTTTDLNGHLTDEHGPLGSANINLTYAGLTQVLLTDNNGDFHLHLDGTTLPLGVTTINAVFNATDIDAGASASVSLAINPATSVIHITGPQSSYTNVDNTYNGVLTVNETGIAGATINITIDSQSHGNITTNTDGSFAFNANFTSPSTYHIKASYAGTSDRRISKAESNTVDVVASVLPPKEYTTVLDLQYVPAKDELTVRLTSENGQCYAKVSLDISVDGSPYTVATTDANGIVVQKMSLQPGHHSISVSYKGFTSDKIVCDQVSKSVDANLSVYQALSEQINTIIPTQTLILGIAVAVGTGLIIGLFRKSKSSAERFMED